MGRVGRLQERAHRAARRQQVRRQGIHAVPGLHQGAIRVLQGRARPDAPEFGRSAVDLAEFQEDSVKKARRILARYDGVLIADSVGLGKTWIGKKLLEDFAYHRRQKARRRLPGVLARMWTKELGSATIAATIVGMEELGRANFDPQPYADYDVILIDESHNFRNEKANRYLALDTIIQLNGGRGRDGERKKVILLSATPINNDLLRPRQPDPPVHAEPARLLPRGGHRRLERLLSPGPAAWSTSKDAAAGVVLFNLLEEIMVRNTRPYIRAAYPNATIKGKPVAFPEPQAAHRQVRPGGDLRRAV